MEYDKELLETFKKLGQNIRKLRKIKGMSIKELSLKTEIRENYLKKIEAGVAFGVLIDKHLLKITNALDVKMIDLL